MGGASRTSPLAIAVLLFGLLVAWMFWPALAGTGSFVHGDNISVGLALQSLLARSLDGGVFPLWSDQIYGGHPIFAEGQGAFAHPLNLLLFGLLDPLHAHDLFFPLCSLIAGLSSWGLCRKLGASPVASLVGGLTFACAPGWLWLSGNATIAGTAAWLPASLLALEHWWEKPDPTRAALLGGAVASMILAGYPQIAHGALIFMATCVALRCLGAPYRARPRLLGRHLASGLLAVAIALGLSAVQLLPLLELAGESIRAEGITLVAPAPASWHYRGLLFTSPVNKVVATGIGSLLVSSLALAALLRRPDPRLIGYLAASALLFLLSMGEQSWLYRVLHHALPGLDSFRTTQLYGVPVLVGASVLAAAGVDRLASLGRPGRRTTGALAAIAIALCAACVALDHEALSRANHVIAALAWAGLALLLAFAPVAEDTSGPHATTPEGNRLSQRYAIPVSLLALLLLEIVWLRAPLLGFAPSEILRTPPATARFITAENTGQNDFKIANVPHFFAYLGFASASNPRLAKLLRSDLSSLEAAGNLIWDLGSLHANLALPLVRREAVSQRIEAEVRGRSGRAPGSRLIDLLGVRYVVVHATHLEAGYAPDLYEVFRDASTKFAILENRHALPRLQLRSGPVWVDDAEEAVALLGEAKGSTLLIEDPSGSRFGRGAGIGPERDSETGSERVGSTLPPGDRAGAGAGPDRVVTAAEAPPRPSRFAVLARSAERYEVAIDLPEPAWLFVADAWYPGWEAWVDGAAAPLYAANALGKAVPVPAGAHKVVVRFRSVSARLGASVTVVTLLAILLGLLWRSLERETRDAAP